MGVAIYRDAEPDRWTEKVENRLRLEHDMLPTELQTIQLRVGQRTPKSLLRLGRISPHFVRALQEFGFRGHHFPTPTPPLKGRGLLQLLHQSHTIPVSLNGLGSIGGIVASLSSHCQKPTSIQRPSL